MLNINSKNLCEHCFAEISGKSGKCPFCSYPKNNEKYPTSLPEGTILAGRYVVGRVLGKGGFGVTYLCYDSKDKTRVAIKEYLPDSLTHRNTGETQVSTYGGESEEYFKTGAQKFYDEAKLVSRFNGNPNIISVYEFFYENNTTYFVMEYLDGIDLKHYIKEKGGKISEAEVIYIALKITEALMIVHSTDVLHRDISPDNIFLCNDGKVKLIDFGAARQVVGEASKSLSVILKQGFAPLEQYQKRGKQGSWTDIYALGASLYYALTGEILDDAMSRITDDNVSFEGISPDFAQILEKMLAVRKEDRYQNTFELKAALSSLAIAPKAFEAKAPETPAVTECLPEVKKEIVEEKAEPLKNEEKKINVGGIAEKTIAKLQENIKSNSEKASDSDKKKKIITVILIFLLAAGLIIGGGLVIAEFFSFCFYAEKANSFLRFAGVVEGVLVFIVAVILSAVILKDKTDSSSRNKLKKILISVCSVAVIVPVITNILSREIAYQEACSYLDAEAYKEAMYIFEDDLGGYKDSEEKLKSLQEKDEPTVSDTTAKSEMSKTEFVAFLNSETAKIEKNGSYSVKRTSEYTNPINIPDVFNNLFSNDKAPTFDGIVSDLIGIGTTTGIVPFSDVKHDYKIRTAKLFETDLKTFSAYNGVYKFTLENATDPRKTNATPIARFTDDFFTHVEVVNGIAEFETAIAVNNTTFNYKNINVEVTVSDDKITNIKYSYDLDFELTVKVLMSFEVICASSTNAVYSNIEY